MLSFTGITKYISQLHISILNYLLTNYNLYNIFAKCFIQIIVPNYEPFTSLHLKYIILELQQSAKRRRGIQIHRTYCLLNHATIAQINIKVIWWLESQCLTSYHMCALCITTNADV